MVEAWSVRVKAKRDFFKIGQSDIPVARVKECGRLAHKVREIDVGKIPTLFEYRA
jgi:hypothetical protein